MSQQRQALAAAIACYVLWGAIPVLFIIIGRAGASPWEILGQRALWSAPWAALLVAAAGQWDQVRRAFSSPRLLGLLAASAALIGSGWAVYVWSVVNGRNLEASLGYYITPLLNMAAGAALFRERMDRLGALAVALAGIGVVLQALALGHLPIISLFLAATFWGYGLIRRRAAIEAQAGLFVECALMAAPGAAFVLWLSERGGALFGHSTPGTLLLLLTGPATVAPLALFSWTVRRLPFSTIGFLQFIGPTMGFAVGLITGEALTPLRALSFAFVWAGVAVFMAGAAWAGARLHRRRGGEQSLA
ncbi:MAG TPA: EamA family transporter RarD [Caulobacteraceae bacterium]|nr:EamA family transporter RarD [Caulobacteraceae bacterium]